MIYPFMNMGIYLLFNRGIMASGVRHHDLCSVATTTKLSHSPSLAARGNFPSGL